MVVIAAAKEELRISYIKSEKPKIKDADGHNKNYKLSVRKRSAGLFGYINKKERIQTDRQRYQYLSCLFSVGNLIYAVLLDASI